MFDQLKAVWLSRRDSFRNINTSCLSIHLWCI